MQDPVLIMEDVSYTYENSGFSLNNVSVQILKGEKIAVLGNNGAGKSTFFLLCNGVYKPHSGNIHYKGAKITYSKKDLVNLRKGVGIVFQDPNQQIIGSSVESEVSFGPCNLKLDKNEIEQRVSDSLEAMNIARYKKTPPHFLSGGEKKRVTIAGVLAMHPEVILFDEPTASLDPVGTHMLKEVLGQLHDIGKTLVLSTHDIDFAWEWADRVLVFSQGALIYDGAAAGAFANDEMLQAAGIRKPLLYQVSQLLSQDLKLDINKIRSTEDLKALLQNI